MDGIVIKSVEPGSICDEGGIVSGDVLLSINGNSIQDVFDYRFSVMEEELRLVVSRDKSGNLSEIVLDIEKDQYEDIGLEFDTYLMDSERSCTNDCVFCFINQMPKGMRDSLYFKDDDARLSFLSGNYITMTNMKYHELDRIIKYRLSPINVSVHTTDPALRCSMMHNRFAGDVMDKLKYLTDAGISVNCQIVLCRGINDGAMLERSIEDLMTLWPGIDSVAIVPAGLTDHREGLPHIEPHNSQTAEETLDLIGRYQQQCLDKFGTRLFYPSDEFYLLSGREIPEADYYEGYPQLDNGVGMIALFREEFAQALQDNCHSDYTKGKVTLVTGLAFAPELKRAMDQAMAAYDGLDISTVGIRNDFFGHNITVAGLLTGQDISAQLQGMDLGRELILPRVMLKADEDIFLDDWTPEMLSESLGGIKITFVDEDPESLINTILK